MMKPLRFLWVGWWCFSALLALAGPLDTWYWRNPLPQGNPLYGACYGEGLFIAVGRSGTIVISPDGRNWLPQEAGTELDLFDVCFGDRQFVAVGDFGVVLTSPDGKQWTVQDTSWFSTLTAVTWGNGKYVAVGDETTILVSTNGENWTLEGMGSTPLFDITYGNDRFVAVGGSYVNSTQYSFGGASTNLVLTSADGNRWERHQIPGCGQVISVGFGQGTFIAAAYNTPSSSFSSLLYSQDGKRWSRATLPYYHQYSPLATICTTSNAFFAFIGGSAWNSSSMGNYCLRSENGKEWLVEYLPEAAFIEGAAASPDTVVAVGTRAWSMFQPMWFRNSSGSWENIVRGEGIALEKVSYQGGKFLYLQAATVPGFVEPITRMALSTNGASWAYFLVSTNAGFKAVAYGDSQYLAVGTGGLLATSPDAESWTSQNTGITNDLLSIAAGNGVFVTTTSTGMVCRSTDGISWDPYELPGNPALGEIAYGNAFFLIPDAGDGGLWISSDGLDWEKHSPEGLAWISAISFWQDRFIGCDAQGNWFVSSNGLAWKQIRAHQGGVEDWMMAYYDGQYVLVGGTTYSYWSSYLLTSPDGQMWEAHNMPATKPLTSIAFGNKTAVVTIRYGGIMQSAPLTNMAPQVGIPPASIAVTPGNPASLMVTPIGTEPMSYQWITDKEPIANPHGPILVLSNLPAGTSREYRVVISNALGTVTSPTARVVVGEVPQLAMLSGTNAQLTLQGTAGLSYQVDYLESVNAADRWQPLTNISLLQPTVTFMDLLRASSNRFYRAKLVPE